MIQGQDPLLCTFMSSGRRGELKAQLADILEAQGSDLDHGGLRSPMAEDQRGFGLR